MALCKNTVTAQDSGCLIKETRKVTCYSLTVSKADYSPKGEVVAYPDKRKEGYPSVPQKAAIKQERGPQSADLEKKVSSR